MNSTDAIDWEEEKKLEQWRDYQDYLQEIEIDDDDRRFLEWWKR